MQHASLKCESMEIQVSARGLKKNFWHFTFFAKPNYVCAAVDEIVSTSHIGARALISSYTS